MNLYCMCFTVINTFHSYFAMFAMCCATTVATCRRVTAHVLRSPQEVECGALHERSSTKITKCDHGDVWACHCTCVRVSVNAGHRMWRTARTVNYCRDMPTCHCTRVTVTAGHRMRRTARTVINTCHEMRHAGVSSHTLYS